MHVLELQMHPLMLSWRRDVGSKEYPSLARDFLGVPIATSCVEHKFNSGRDQYGIRHLSGDTVEALMVVQDRLPSQVNK
jgi:hypothetical protein